MDQYRDSKYLSETYVRIDLNNQTFIDQTDFKQTHTHTHTHTHIYIYLERERERERETDIDGWVLQLLHKLNWSHPFTKTSRTSSKKGFRIRQSSWKRYTLESHMETFMLSNGNIFVNQHPIID